MCMGMKFRTFDLGAITLILNLVDTSVSKVLMPVWPIHACGLPMGGRHVQWHGIVVMSPLTLESWL